jgi:hypothetical protein
MNLNVGKLLRRRRRGVRRRRKARSEILPLFES